MTTVRNRAMIDKEMKTRNIWIVITYLLLNHAGGFEYSLQHQYFAVKKLQYHLSRDQLVMLDDRKELFNIVHESNA